MPWVDVETIVRDNPPKQSEKREVEDYMRRRAKPRFYADENMTPLAIYLLKEFGGNVLTVTDVSNRGHPDENHACAALRLGPILVTCDRDYLDETRFPLIHCPTIIICNFGAGSRDDIVRTFSCLAGPFIAPQIYDKWMKITASRD